METADECVSDDCRLMMNYFNKDPVSSNFYDDSTKSAAFFEFERAKDNLLNLFISFRDSGKISKGAV